MQPSARGGTQAPSSARTATATATADNRAGVRGAAVAEWAAGDVWVADNNPEGTYPAAAMLAEAVKRQARLEAANQLGARASTVWSTLRAACVEEVARLEALPAPPSGLWQHPDPTQLIARTKGHEPTLSVLASVVDRFWSLQHLADFVRGPAGHGFERLPDGAPRLAVIYRDWRKAMAGTDTLRTTHRTLRLWQTVIDGWQPGIWTAEDIARPTKAENTFSARLARFGSAVTGG